MKPYAVLDCDNVKEISNGIYQYLCDSTDLLTNNARGWHFLNHKDLLKSVPELIKFFSKLKLIPNSASVVILYETGDLPIHIDEMPVIAKINFPVSNTVGWANRWFQIDQREIDNFPKVQNQFGSLVPKIDKDNHYKILDEINNLNMPIVFNSMIPHDVIKITGNSPRIIASFTFYNEPTEFLK